MSGRRTRTDPDERARRRVWIAGVGFVACLAATIAFGLAALPSPGKSVDEGSVAFLPVVLLFPVVGLLILFRHPRNRVGWILLVIGYAWVEPVSNYGKFALSRGLPGGAIASAVSGGTWAPPIVLTGTVLLLRFPSGELLSPRWRKVELFAIATMVAIVACIAFFPGDLGDLGYPAIRSPLEIAGVGSVAKALLPVALLCLPVTIVLSAVSVVIRYRRSRGMERLQMKWLAAAAAFLALLYFIAILISIGNVYGASQAAWVGVVDSLAFLSFALFPIAIGIAVFRYKLYEIDVVINKAIVYGSLATFVTLAYVGIVVGIGHAIGSERSLPLQVAATVLVAVAFQPLRERVQRFANRLVYGRRATPYQVLARFAEGVAGTYATDEIASALARLLVEGTGAERSDIWLRSNGDRRLEARWPPGPADETELPVDDDRTRVFPVVHRGETLGELVIRKAASEPVGPRDEKLVSDVAGQAGLVLRNLRLIEDLKASRQRLVATRDDERRKLERNIHDGAQQRLVALAVLYNMAEGLARPLGAERRAAIAELGLGATSSLEALRELARGIYPAVLSDRGLVAALEGLARKSSVPVEVVADGIDRYEPQVEATVYFCCVQALQNVQKEADVGARVVIRLEGDENEIRFAVLGEGVGFDATSIEASSGIRNMQDRIGAISGALDVRSTPGGGSTLSGRVPARRVAGTAAGVG